ncbi:tripartite tricarboxylate transporter substrate binding protein [Bordetella sp. N]|uniref:Bug family tripartite tricarboxylate transporter substrate binding protein n=1 Tax=Bordetella sp. N TaxID=1746199 RepID=UPI00070BB926|nr:tripartite tricarboxylate transporter substrate binding protein [Bordetella sp. N]ALM83620.1 hypothetical protein ASB57_12135 [Bordetella sp. N]
MKRPLEEFSRLRRCLALTALLGATLSAAPTHAEDAAKDWPSKPIRLVVGYPPGGANDQMARQLAPRLGKALGASIVVENRAGADGVIGTTFVAQQPPDGYTLALAGMSPLVLSAFTFSHVPYDAHKDLVGASTVASSPMLFAVSPSLPVKTFQDLVAYAKAHPGKLNFATAGSGGSTRVMLELFKQTTGADVHYISYKGASQGLTDLLGGRLDAMIIDFSVLYPLVQQGKLRALATSGAHRSPLLPDVPTVTELGYPKLAAGNWYAVVAPAGTPAPIMDKLNKAVVQIANSEDMTKAFAGMSVEAMTQTNRADFGRFLQSEFDRWGHVIQAAGIKAE